MVVISRNVCQVLYRQHLGHIQQQQSNGFEDLNFDLKTLSTCKLFEVNGPPRDFTQVDLIAEARPEDLSGEHLPEALKLKTGEKSVGTERVSARHS